MSSRGIRTRDLAIHDDRRFWPRFSGILGALVKWLSSRTYAQVPLLEEVSFFMVWFDPDLPVLHIHLNNTGPTARLTARCYRARFPTPILTSHRDKHHVHLISQPSSLKELEIRATYQKQPSSHSFQECITYQYSLRHQLKRWAPLSF